ncbi:MAG: group 1 truncated hemoglobin [Myxococcota bacterium]|nr:group 1 truncated hemoglobin [Myxococcota bacterium]MEC9442635.1 group 1 truncated hemoglobin [Myxococcota bacterium]
MSDWTLIERVGGEAALRALLRDFYDRLYEDMIVGFLFQPHDKESLIAHQFDYVCAHIGLKTTRYTGRSMREAHRHLPILPGQFDRRHQLLRDVLRDHNVPEDVQEVWLTLDTSLREFILSRGAMERDRILNKGAQDTSGKG